MGWLWRGSCLLTVLVFALIGHFLWAVHQPLSIPQTQYFQLKRARPCISVAWDLYRQGVFKSRWQVHYFLWWVDLHYAESLLKAGEYELTGNITMQELLNRFVQGKVMRWRWVIREGWQWRDLELAIQNDFVLGERSYSIDILNAKAKTLYANLEGLFLANTYWIERGVSAESVLERAFAEQQRVLADEWAQRSEDIPFSTPYEALTMASIIEKETGIDSEREQISGVMARRLRRGMRLQVDASVRYGMGEAGKGVLLYEHLRQDTPYNTYMHLGLPPTPIAYPSRASLHAALHPDHSDSLFYVALGDGSGRHAFSANFKEHRQHILERNLISRVVLPSVILNLN